MRALLLFTLVACGGAQQNLRPAVDARKTAHDSLVQAVGNADALLKLMGRPVVNGGLWFDDESCNQQFPAGEISVDRLPAFATCLAKLPLRASRREDVLADVVVMTYEPGFEIEARVVDDAGAPRLAWIGFASRGDGDPTPTISSEALEAHRMTGDRDGPLEPGAASQLERENTAVEAELGAEIAKLPERYRAESRASRDRRVSFAWIKVCIDDLGTAISATPFESTSEAAAVLFSQAAKQWTFRPISLRGRAIAACALTRLTFPPRAALPETLPLPPPLRPNKQPPLVLVPGSAGARRLEKLRLAGTKAILPRDITKLEIQQSGVARIESMFRICVDEAGAVESVMPLQVTGFADYDRDLKDGLRRWRYSPYLIDGKPVPICMNIRFVYTQSHGPPLVIEPVR